jgi:tRNASer (uridine44-2'-O)-methyltransferase
MPEPVHSPPNDSRMTVPSAEALGGFTTPPFRPMHQPPDTPSPLAAPTEPWVEALVSSCHFGLSSFLATLKELCLHPERNSSLILRADPLPPRGDADVSEGRRLGLGLHEEVGVRLMPKQPKRDGRLQQRCLFYRSPDKDPDTKEEGLVVYVPNVTSPEDLPFYYPPVKRLAFRWEAAEPAEDTEEGDLPVRGRISIAYLPWPEAQLSSLLAVRPAKAPRKRSPLAGPPIGGDATEEVPPPAVIFDASERPVDPRSDDRLQRTLAALLERLFKHGYGTMVGYRKRVSHDVSPSPFRTDEAGRHPARFVPGPLPHT